MGSSFDQAKNNDLFYLSPEAFQNPDFKRGLVMFLSPEGKSARVFITHESDPATPEGIARVDSERKAAQDGLKMSSLSDAKVFLGGTAATYKDIADGAKYDLLIAMVRRLGLKTPREGRSLSLVLAIATTLVDSPCGISAGCDSRPSRAALLLPAAR
jgi:RND superfamily putative drug exporter